MKQTFQRPNIMVSKCLGFANCRFNGQTILDDFIIQLKDHVNFTTLCPEYDIGLGAPRFPVRIIRINGEDRLIQPSTKRDVSDEMNSYSDRTLSAYKTKKIHDALDGFILKFRSPSCGIGNVKIYSDLSNVGSFSKTKGFFAAKVFEYFPDYPIEDEGRLKNFRLRESFLTKIYCLASYRKIRQIKGLVDFHARNKFLLMSYGQEKMRKLGNIVARYQNNFDEIYEQYYGVLLQALSNIPKKTEVINVLNHMAGFFSDTNSTKEKSFFSESILLYREGRIPLSSVVFMIKAWALRDKKDYILNQTFLNPFPDDLLELKDSGKKLDL